MRRDEAAAKGSDTCMILYYNSSSEKIINSQNLGVLFL